MIVGVTIQFLLGTFLEWRQVALASMWFPSVAFILLFFVPESPYYLLTKNRLDEAKKSLAWLRGWSQPEDVEEEYVLLNERINETSKMHETVQTLTLKERIEPYIHRSFLIPFFLVSFSFFVGHFAGMTTLQIYAVRIFQILQAPMDEYYATLLLGKSRVIR